MIKLTTNMTIICLLFIGCMDNADQLKPLTAEITLPERDQEIWEGELVYFEAGVTGGLSPVSYSWDFSIVHPSISNIKTGPITFGFEGAYSLQYN
jgi:hypothetical protein